MTLGTRIIRDLRPLTRLPFDVHLMMVNPEWILPELVDCGADRISVHYEACPYPRRVLRQITSLGAKAGLAFNPATPLPESCISVALFIICCHSYDRARSAGLPIFTRSVGKGPGGQAGPRSGRNRMGCGWRESRRRICPILSRLERIPLSLDGRYSGKEKSPKIWLPCVRRLDWMWNAKHTDGLAWNRTYSG